MELISKRAAIAAIEFDITYAKAINKETGEVTQMFERENKALEDAAERVRRLPTIQPEPHWIPVTERLPEESGLYQVTDMQGHVVRYVFNANESSVEYWKRCVKAWMPLPESYKGVTE